MIFIDGDFHNDQCGPCEFHCWPSCHPAQVGPESVFGCTHRAWPQNRAGDFVPIVGCGGNSNRCEIPRNGLVRMRAGARRRLRNLTAKIESTKADIAWYEAALGRVEANAAIAAADESPWRSMESIPKWDKVLLMLGDCMAVGYWYPLMDCCVSDGRVVTASHWAPLPAAPEVKP